MLDYHIYIETYRLDFSPSCNISHILQNSYSKNITEQHWKPVNNSHFSTSNNPNQNLKPSVLQTQVKPIFSSPILKTKSRKALKDSELFSLITNTHSNISSKVNYTKSLIEFFSKNIDFRFGCLNIETYSAENLSIYPEIEELETLFYKISFLDSAESSLQLPNSSYHPNRSSELAISWEPKKSKGGSEKAFISPNNNTIMDGFNNDPYILTNNNGITLPNSDSISKNSNSEYANDQQKNNNKSSSENNSNTNINEKIRKQTAVPMGVFDIIPNSKQEYPLGVLHLYKSLPNSTFSQNNSSGTNIKNNSSACSDTSLDSSKIDIPVQTEKTMAVLTVPGNSSMSNYMVLLKFNVSEEADEFFEYYNGKSFSPLEPETCNIVRVLSVTITNSALPVYLFPIFYDEVSLYKRISEANSALQSSKSLDHEPDIIDNHKSLILIKSSQDGKVNCEAEFIKNLKLERSNLYKSLMLNMITELPTCPVCLERLDTSASGLLTILCQHTFHSTCLEKWNDNSCPVCRFAQAGMFVNDDLFEQMIQQNEITKSNPIYSNTIAPQITNTSIYVGGNETALKDNTLSGDLLESKAKIIENDEPFNQCRICGCRQQLWICLICGYIGCGRYFSGHAHAHFIESGHIYSMDLESQRVWDYVGDGYVHRILINRTDGKLVELSAPSSSFRTEENSSYNLSTNLMTSNNSNFCTQSSTDLNSTSNRNYMANQLELSSFINGVDPENFKNQDTSKKMLNSEHIYTGAASSTLQVCESTEQYLKHSPNKNNQIILTGASSSQIYNTVQTEANIDTIREKLAAVASEYEITLKAQLEMNNRVFEKKTRALENLCKEYVKKQYVSKQNLILTQQKLEEERSISKNMSQNFKQLQEENKNLKSMVEDLNEQVKDLYMHFETLNKVDNDPELKDAITQWASTRNGL
ncbi:hypothetical protein BB561_003929 [Smittium simulii]|uniref:RING-type domain-containing protein n=1 Tax=Smittium simulii TaxID=133385 RepID=A0A2T9YJ43_9FUNG|nr:hypothetical protein BB561_003929 [Smittium simulii]